MNDRSQRFECLEFQEIGHRLLDGELMEAHLGQRLERHLSGCRNCRESLGQLRTIQQELRALPVVPFPQAALEQLLSSTSGRNTSSGKRSRWSAGWKIAVAASLLAALTIGGWSLDRRLRHSDRAPTVAELDRAAEETRFVLQLTSRALRRAEDAAVRGVLVDRISPALQRLPLLWRANGSDEARSGRHGV